MGYFPDGSSELLKEFAMLAQNELKKNRKGGDPSAQPQVISRCRAVNSEMGPSSWLDALTDRGPWRSG